MLKAGLILGLAGVALAGLAVGISYLVRRPFHKHIYETVGQAPQRRVAIIFGAGVWPGGQLSPILADRVWIGVSLYKAGKVEKLLMTGDNRFVDYNEPKHMKEYAVALGVPPGDVILDYAGRRTYDSCYRALHIFQVPDAILVTQRFHLPRALMIANGLGLDAVGVAADQRPYARMRWYAFREMLATLVAFWQAYVTRPEPIMGETLPIFPD